MRTWMKQHGSRFSSTYTVMYHATDKDIPVMEEGLLPTSRTRHRFNQSENGYVYLATTPELAKGFGDVGNNGDSVVYEVIVPVYSLLPDTGQLDSLRSADTAIGRSVSESLVYSGSARIKGAIERWQIRPFDYEGYHQYKERQSNKEPQMSDEEVRRHYEYILTSTNLYPSDLHRAMREIVTDAPEDYEWSRKSKQVCDLFSQYGNREYQGEVLYRTALRGEDGISMYFGDGYTYLPWSTVANIVNAMIEAGEYPAEPQNERPAVSGAVLEEARIYGIG